MKKNSIKKYIVLLLGVLFIGGNSATLHARRYYYDSRYWYRPGPGYGWRRRDAAIVGGTAAAATLTAVAIDASHRKATRRAQERDALYRRKISKKNRELEEQNRRLRRKLRAQQQMSHNPKHHPRHGHYQEKSMNPTQNVQEYEEVEVYEDIK